MRDKLVDELAKGKAMEKEGIFIGKPDGYDKRLTWIFTVFRQAPSFRTIMQVYPLSLGVTAVVILLATLFVKPSRRYITGAEG